MNLPWPTKKLGEICRIQTGKKDVNEGNPCGKYPFFTCSREKTYSDTYSFDTEAILVAGNGDVGNTHIYKGKFEAYQRTYVLDGFKEDIKFIYYFLIGNLKRVLGKSKSGSTMPYIRKGDLENLQIPLPPLPIQQKIVSILDTIQSAIEVQEKMVEKTKELKKSMMADLFKYGAPSFRKGRKLKKTEIGEIPENWDVVRLGEVVEKIQYGISKKGQREGEYPILRMNNLMEGQINTQDLQFVDLTKDEFDKFKLIKGDIIFNRTNSIELVGKTALFDLERDFVFASYLLRIRVNILKLLPQFLNWYFNWGKSQERLKKLASRGASQVNISATRLRTFQIPLPSLPEQREIAEILQTIDQKIEIEKKKKELYEELFKTMLNKIMNQEIDVEKIKI